MLQNVSIHAPTRGATSVSSVYSTLQSFNSRTHAGCDTIRCYLLGQAIVSIHAPTRGATCNEAPMPPKQLVSIHAPTRGATIVNGSNSVAPEVSIHAPTRGATRRRSQRQVYTHVSIHAPTRGATYTCANLQSVGNWFQFTHPRGVRHYLFQRAIHLFSRFNSRTHAGCDVQLPAAFHAAKCFNSRTHAGCDIRS